MWRTSDRLLGDDGLRRTPCFKIAIAIGKAHDRAGVGDVHPLRLGTRRIEADPEGLGQVLGERLDGARTGSVGPWSQHAHSVSKHLGDEDVPVGRNAQQARFL